MERSVSERRSITIPLPVVPSWIRWTAVLLVAGTIFYWSVPTAPPPEPTGPTPTEATEGTPDIVPLAAWRHFVAYATLGLVLAYALVTRPTARVQKALLVFSIVFLYGLTMELWQAQVPGRTASYSDLFVNAIGAGASILWYLVEPRFRHHEINWRALLRFSRSVMRRVRTVIDR